MGLLNLRKKILYVFPYENGPRWLPRYLEKAEVITSVFGENPGITEKAPVLRTTALDSRGNFQNTAVFDTGAFESRGLATGAFENRGICSKLPVVLPTGSFKTAAHFHKGYSNMFGPTWHFFMVDFSRFFDIFFSPIFFNSKIPIEWM